MLLSFIYTCVTSIGILGIGNHLWLLIKSELFNSQQHKELNGFKEHAALTLGISWFLGYFFFEGILLTAATFHLFTPLLVLTISALLTLLGIYALIVRRNSYHHVFKIIRETPLWEFLIFISLCGFVLFWNLYPSFDVDSLAFYFTAIKLWLSEGGKNFSVFHDVRYVVPLGENYIFSLGFALFPNSTFIPQLFHAFSKIMLMCCVYGFLKSLKINSFALIGVAFLISEEHLLTSGANVSVRINMPLTASVFLLGAGLFIFLKFKNKEFLLLSLIASLNIMFCKYLGISYAGLLGIILTLLFIVTRQWVLLKLNLIFTFPRTFFILGAAIFFTILPYGYNWILTGTPFYPASLGPFLSPTYDSIANFLASNWHYRLSLLDALKNFSVFMVWPGILPSKLLVPLTLCAGILFALTPYKNKNYFLTGLSFVGMSVIVILLTQTYMVFEMRYYRYGIGLYSCAATLLIFSIFQSIVDNNHTLQRIQTWLMAFFILIFCTLSIRYSFNTMGPSRPYAHDILHFLTKEVSVNEIMTSRFPKISSQYKEIIELDLDDARVGFILSFGWPHTIYPIKGKNIAFINSAGFKSEVYFNEGLFAQALLDTNIDVVYNGLVDSVDYPLKGGAVHRVFQQCGQTLPSKTIDIIHLSEACLEKLAFKKDLQDGHKRLSHALSDVKALPKYEPFNIPDYGGRSGVIR